MPRILALDIETSPALVYTFQLRDVTIGIDWIVDPGGILCWSAKWFGEKKIYYADVRGGKRKMLTQIRDLLSESDAVCTYNGNGFDLQKINGELVLQRVNPCPPVTSIDLWQTVNKLGYVSSKLAFLVKQLGIGEKVKNAGAPLWIGCMNRDKESWRNMREYNIGDTTLLESAHEILMPYIRHYPRLYETGCHRCGCTKTTGPTKFRTTSTYRFPLNQCASCKGWYQGKRQSLRSASVAA